MHGQLAVFVQRAHLLLKVWTVGCVVWAHNVPFIAGKKVNLLEVLWVIKRVNQLSDVHRHSCRYT